MSNEQASEDEEEKEGSVLRHVVRHTLGLVIGGVGIVVGVAHEC
jgi:hypothetical protein